MSWPLWWWTICSKYAVLHNAVCIINVIVSVKPCISDHPKSQAWVVAYESLGHIGSKFCLISIWLLQRLTPCFKCFILLKSQFQDKKTGASHWEISVSHTTQVQFTLCYLLSGRVKEVKNKRKFQTFISLSGHSQLQEVVTYNRLQI